MPAHGEQRRVAWRVTVASLLGALALTACGSDEPGHDAATASVDETSTTVAPAQDPVPDGVEDGVVDGVVEVELTDFAFEGLPGSVPAGTRLTISNASELELHKLSALPIAEDDERPVEELMALPGAELAEILRVRPATVLTAAPGGPQVDEVGDGTLSEPGRYVIICAVPLGLDPDTYLEQVADGGRPSMMGGGRPHFALGMVTELVVE